MILTPCCACVSLLPPERVQPAEAVMRAVCARGHVEDWALCVGCWMDVLGDAEDPRIDMHCPRCHEVGECAPVDIAEVPVR